MVLNNIQGSTDWISLIVSVLGTLLTVGVLLYTMWYNKKLNNHSFKIISVSLDEAVIGGVTIRTKIILKIKNNGFNKIKITSVYLNFYQDEARIQYGGQSVLVEGTKLLMPNSTKEYIYDCSFNAITNDEINRLKKDIKLIIDVSSECHEDSIETTYKFITT